MGTAIVDCCTQSILPKEDNNMDIADAPHQHIVDELIANILTKKNNEKPSIKRDHEHGYAKYPDIPDVPDVANVHFIDAEREITEFEYISQNRSYFSLASSVDEDDDDDDHSLHREPTVVSTSKSSSANSPHFESSPKIAQLFNCRSMSYQNDNEFKDTDKKCQVTNCKVLKRIVRALKWHSRIADRDQFILKMIETKYDKFILADYQHFLREHLIEIGSVRDEVCHVIEICNVQTCAALKRFVEELQRKDLSKCDNETFCADFMDVIHCNIMHS